MISDRRTSYETRIPEELTRQEHETVSELMAMQTSHFEPLKVTRYRSGEFFKAHTDSRTRNRPLAATLIVYLNDCPCGGETHFTKLGVSVRPQKGMGLIHFPCYVPGSRQWAIDEAIGDPRTQHESLPVLAGEKWVVQQFCWSTPFTETSRAGRIKERWEKRHGWDAP